jgi:hypothetical protein
MVAASGGKKARRSEDDEGDSDGEEDDDDSDGDFKPSKKAKRPKAAHGSQVRTAYKWAMCGVLTHNAASD